MAFGLQLSKAQNATVADDPILSGSDLKSEDATKQSDAIFSGKITNIGPPLIKGIGPLFDGVEVHVIQTYLGSVDQNVIISIRVVRRDENPPILGQTYLFFVKKNSSPQLRVFKLLPATDANIAKVKALIAAAPASK